jgi:hypothetical protein
MKFARLMMVVFVAAGLAACKGEEPDKAKTATDPEPISVAKVDTTVASEFPPGFTPDFGYRIRSKRTVSEGGVQYRKLVVEFKELEAPDVDQSVQRNMEKIGYKRYKTIRQDNGAIVGDYGRNGHRVTVTTTPLQESMELFEPGAKGTVYFVWKP